VKNLLQYQNSRNWYFRFYDEQGKRRTVSLGTDDEAEAIKQARLIQNGDAVRRIKNIQVQSPIDRLIEDYLAWAQARSRKPMRPLTANNVKVLLKKFVRETGIATASGLKVKVIDTWIGKLKAEGKSQETLRSYARDISTFSRWLSGRGLIVPLVIELPDRKPKIRKTWLRKGQVANVISSVEPKIGPHSSPEGKLKAKKTADELRFILYCGFHAGLRRKEIGVAKVKWFDLKAGLLHVENYEGFTSKDTENRTIPLTTEFHEFVKSFLRGRNPEEFCIQPGRLASRSRYRYDFEKTVRSHFDLCGVDLDIHGMRRSFASNLVSEGESIFIVAEWLGDGVQVVQKHYAYLAPHSGSINRLVA
jgi:integrase